MPSSRCPASVDQTSRAIRAATPITTRMMTISAIDHSNPPENVDLFICCTGRVLVPRGAQFELPRDNQVQVPSLAGVVHQGPVMSLINQRLLDAHLWLWLILGACYCDIVTDLASSTLMAVLLFRRSVRSPGRR